MINQLNSGGAVQAAQSAPLASSRAYANGLGKYNPGSVSSNPYLSVLGSAFGTLAGNVASNGMLSKKIGEWLNKKPTDPTGLAANSAVGQSALDPANSAESYIDNGGMGGYFGSPATGNAGDNYFMGGTGGIGNGADLDAYLSSLKFGPSAY